MKVLIAALALSLPACATTTTPAEGAPAPGGTCNAAAARALVGRTVTDALVAQAQRLTGARRVRSIRPGMMVTMDYSPDRLNIHIGPDDRIERFACG